MARASKTGAAHPPPSLESIRDDIFPDMFKLAPTRHTASDAGHPQSFEFRKRFTKIESGALSLVPGVGGDDDLGDLSRTYPLQQGLEGQILRLDAIQGGPGPQENMIGAVVSA